MKKIIGATLAGMLLAGTANATAINYSFNGTFVDDAVLSGGFRYDAQAMSVSERYSNFTIAVSTLSQILDRPSLLVTTSNGNTFLYVANSASNQITLGFGANVFGNLAFTSGPLDLNTSYNRSIALRSGTITASPDSVPEPATWGMFISGFGVMGAALRKRQRVNVSFA